MRVSVASQLNSTRRRVELCRYKRALRRDDDDDDDDGRYLKFLDAVTISVILITDRQTDAAENSTKNSSLPCRCLRGEVIMSVKVASSRVTSLVPVNARTDLQILIVVSPATSSYLLLRPRR